MAPVTDEWQPVCRVVELQVERGATALVHGQAIAIFRTQDDEVYALGNHDPFAKAAGIARGIVGLRDDVPFVASPHHKHAFDLRSGRCLDDDHVSIPAYDVRVVEGVVLVGHRKEAA
jgi:nitrite reductase (NADH) small subunit